VEVAAVIKTRARARVGLPLAPKGARMCLIRFILFWYGSDSRRAHKSRALSSCY
jgi:hypothetical protein